MVPVNLPQREIMNIVKRAKKWFYKNYEDSVRENYYHIPSSVFDSTYFKNYLVFDFVYGAIAQLVEHLHGMQGVSGSSPLGSIMVFTIYTN